MVGRKSEKEKERVEQDARARAARWRGCSFSLSPRASTRARKTRKAGREHRREEGGQAVEHRAGPRFEGEAVVGRVGERTVRVQPAFPLAARRSSGSAHAIQSSSLKEMGRLKRCSASGRRSDDPTGPRSGRSSFGKLLSTLAHGPDATLFVDPAAVSIVAVNLEHGRTAPRSCAARSRRRRTLRRPPARARRSWLALDDRLVVVVRIELEHLDLPAEARRPSHTRRHRPTSARARLLLDPKRWSGASPRRRRNRRPTHCLLLHRAQGLLLVVVGGGHEEVVVLAKVVGRRALLLWRRSGASGGRRALTRPRAAARRGHVEVSKWSGRGGGGGGRIVSGRREGVHAAMSARHQHVQRPILCEAHCACM